MNLNWILLIIGTCLWVVVWVVVFSRAFWYFRFEDKWIWERTRFSLCAWILMTLCSICILWLLFLFSQQMALIQRELEGKGKIPANAYFPPLLPPGSFVDALGLLGLFVAVLLVCGGIWLISKRDGWRAQTAGLAMVATGLTPLYLTASIKLGKLFDLEAKAELQTQINANLGNGGWFGAESLPPIYPFEKGEGYLERMSSTSLDVASKDSENSLRQHFNVMCEVFASHGQAPTLVMIIGSTDPSPLRSDVRLTFGSNFGLARARAEWVKSQWKAWEQRMGGSLPDACNVPDDNFLTLGSGPSITPEPRGSGHEDLSRDRQVEIWAIWGAQKQEGSKNPKWSLKINAPEINLGDTSGERNGESK